MNLTLHLTDNCNMRCSYCIHEKICHDMSEQTLIAACDLAFSKGNKVGLSFFGGEPMMKKNLIIKAIEYCKGKEKQTGKKPLFKMTTNGTYIDSAFVDYALASGLEIALSFDGTAQNISRKFADGSNSFTVVEEKAKLLLKKMPSAYAMLTLDPKAVEELYNSVIYLYNIGFRKISAVLAHGKNVQWTDEHLRKLENELGKLADFYSDIIINDKERLFFSPFDSKIRYFAVGKSSKDNCQPGIRQLAVSTDGRLYPCNQFIGNENYRLGDVYSGVDIAKQLAATKLDTTPDICKGCALCNRCTNSCSCANILETGHINQISPLQCSYEKMLINIVDKMADSLYKTHPDKFLKRFVKQKYV